MPSFHREISTINPVPLRARRDDATAGLMPRSARDRRALFNLQPSAFNLQRDLFPLVISMLSYMPMAQLIVRNIDQTLVDLLKRRAAERGRSAEAEHREILRAALQPQRTGNLKDHLLAMPEVGDDADFAIKRPRARRVTL